MYPKKIQAGSGYWGTGVDVKSKRDNPDKAKCKRAAEKTKTHTDNDKKDK